MKDCYTEDERIAFDVLMKAHDLFVSLPTMHPADAEIWSAAIHQQQMLFGLRILRRDYPNEFAIIKPSI